MSKERLRRSLPDFIRAAWPAIEPETPYVHNWHIDLVAGEVQFLLEGPGDEVIARRSPYTGRPWSQNLIINVPPGTMKSLITSVFAPAWMWLRRPSWRAIFASANPRVALRDSMRCRELLESEWYQETFEPPWSLAEDQNAKSLYKNTRGGFRLATSVGAKIVGERADALFVDDPLDAADAMSKAARDACITWWDQAFANRVANPKTAARCIIMQRLHEEDLSGYLLAKDAQSGPQRSWHHVCLPMEYERGDTAHPRDPRQANGELLFPDRFPRNVLDEERTRLGSAGYAGQMQQRPTAAEGGLFKRNWWRFWKPDGSSGGTAKRPKGCYEGEARARPEKLILTISVDATFKGGEENDWVVMIVIGSLGADRFILERVRRHMTFTESVAELQRLCQRWPLARRKIIEDKANGTAIIDVLRTKIPGLVPVNPEGGKEARASAVSPQVEAGNVYLPDGCPWLDEWVDEFAGFPKGKHDDQVDALSQALLELWASPGMSRAIGLATL